MTYLWPGLPQLWTCGSWSGLAMAVAAAAALDSLLLGTFGWSELIAENVRSAVWAACGIGWIIAAAYSARWCRRQAAVDQQGGDEDKYGEALTQYLKGDYYQAERLLETLLRQNARDLEARLMLATLMRHTGRLEEAGRQLETLARFEGAGKWKLEIEHERELLTEAKTRKKTTVAADPAAGGEPPPTVAHAA